MNSTSGNSILIGASCAWRSARWRRFVRSWSDCTRKHLRDADTQLLGLDDRVDEVRQFVDADALAELLQGLAAQLTHRHVAQHALQLVGEGTVALLGDARERGVQTEAGFDAGRDEVQRVGQWP